MKEPCRSCAFKEIDFGGCRCQAMAITGDPRNTDPACALSPYHGEMVALARAEAHKPAPPFVYRNPRNAAERGKAGSAPAGAGGIADSSFNSIALPGFRAGHLLPTASRRAPHLAGSARPCRPSAR